MKRVFYIFLILLGILTPSIIFLWYISPAFLDAEDMFLGLEGALVFSSLLYIPILISQLIFYRCLKYLFLGGEKRTARTVISSIIVLLCFLFFVIYFAHLCLLV